MKRRKKRRARNRRGLGRVDEELIQRVRNHHCMGLSYEETVDSLALAHSKQDIRLAWHAAKMLGCEHPAYWVPGRGIGGGSRPWQPTGSVNSAYIRAMYPAFDPNVREENRLVFEPAVESAAWHGGGKDLDYKPRHARGNVRLRGLGSTGPKHAQFAENMRRAYDETKMRAYAAQKRGDCKAVTSEAIRAAWLRGGADAHDTMRGKAGGSFYEGGPGIAQRDLEHVLYGCGMRITDRGVGR